MILVIALSKQSFTIAILYIIRQNFVVGFNLIALSIQTLNLLRNLSKEIISKFPSTKGFSVRNLKNMARFYREYPKIEIVQSVTAQITNNNAKSPLLQGWDVQHIFYNLICMVLLISYIYYFIIYVWKIIIDTQTQTYL